MNTYQEEEKIILNLQQVGLIPQKKQCSKCAIEMTIKHRKRKASSKNVVFNWLCPKCSSYFSIFDGTFFGLFKIPLLLIFQILKCWALEMTIV